MVTTQIKIKQEEKAPRTKSAYVDVCQTSLRLGVLVANGRLSAFLSNVLLLPCDQSNRRNVTGNDRNISIYSRSRMNGLKQLYGLQLSVCTDVAGRGGRPTRSTPVSARPGLMGALCSDNKACVWCWVKQSGRVCSAPVTWVRSGRQECLTPASFPEICSGARTSGGNGTGGVSPGATGRSLPSISCPTGRGSN